MISGRRLNTHCKQSNLILWPIGRGPTLVLPNAPWSTGSGLPDFSNNKYIIYMCVFV